MGRWFHDPEFDSFHPLQWKLYAHLLALDNKEKTEEDQEKIEYAMSFVDNEAVNKVRQMREVEKHKPSDKQFSSQLQELFGRALKEKPKQQQNLDQIKVVR